MKKALWKRLPRELKSEFGKYLVIFLFMLFTIGFISGFLVADESMLLAYEESFEKYNIEDGNFNLAAELTEEEIKALEEEGKVQICKTFYEDVPVDTDLDGNKDGTLRLYGERSDMDLVCLMKGEMPEAEDEIAIDRMYADNNDLKVGDILGIGGNEWTITGLVALSDYSCLFSDNNDMMFDSKLFGVAILSEAGIRTREDGKVEYRYSWQYEETPEDDAKKEASEAFLKVLTKYGTVTGFIPAYSNQAIMFSGEDMGSDKAMMEVLLYILIVIMAFVFAVTTNNTITKEASVIGTLRAMGYTRGELLRQYMALPILVTVVASIFGNILGYTVFKDMCAGLYYGSYSLPTYETRWNAEAFVLTTAVPFVIMLVINFAMISRKLRLSPLRFLRHDLGSSKRKKAVRLPHFSFFNRFRLRIILQNRSSFLTLLVGIYFANILLLFGMMMKPLLAHYQDEILEHMLAPYQYILMVPEETEAESAEKFCVESMKNVVLDGEGETITVYGIRENSIYVKEKMPEAGVLISEGYQEKYQVKIGDQIVLKEAYGEKEYEFTVEGTYDYPASLTVFMSQNTFAEVFDKEADYFNGYFSEDELTDLSDQLVASVITEEDLTKVSRQLDISMGNMFGLVNVFAVLLFTLLIYLLTKLIIEKNASSISMIKILGYENREIQKLYSTSTTWVVTLSILVSLVLSTWTMEKLYRYIMASITGWMSLYFEPKIYVEMFLLGFAAYGIVAILQFKKIRKIPMDIALKNVE